jgi:orotate phosphoribosyltransferase
MNKDNNHILNVLKKHNALLEGHFILSSGKRSSQYVQFAKIHENPLVMQELGGLLAEKIKQKCSELKIKIDCVASPAIGAIIPGYQVALSLGAQEYIFCERNAEKKFEFRRNFKIKKGANYLIVEDVITTGLSFGEVAEIIQSEGGNVVMISSFIDRTENRSFDYPFISLIKLDIKTYDPDKLPPQLQSIEPIKPGSRK